MAREFRERPLPMFVEGVREHIRATGQPETHPDLFHSTIDNKARFEILSRILINRRKRPRLDKAPCPMCTADKFLDGRLCWFPDLKVAAVIGHCCADHATNIEANKRFRREEDRNYEESYLLAALPLVPQKLRHLEIMRGPALEARRLNRLIRKQAPALKDAIAFATQHDGRLLITVEFQRLQTGTGPAGFRPGGMIDETLDFGVLRGLPLFASRFQPEHDLDEIGRYLAPWCVGEDEEQVIAAICEMDDVQRHRAYTVLSDIDHRRIPRLTAKLSECAAFFDDANLARFDQWGQHPANPQRLSARTERVQGLSRFVIAYGRQEARLVPDGVLFQPLPQWEVVPKARPATRRR